MAGPGLWKALKVGRRAGATAEEALPWETLAFYLRESMHSPCLKLMKMWVGKHPQGDWIGKHCWNSHEVQ